MSFLSARYIAAVFAKYVAFYVHGPFYIQFSTSSAKVPKLINLSAGSRTGLSSIEYTCILDTILDTPWVSCISIAIPLARRVSVSAIRLYSIKYRVS